MLKSAVVDSSVLISGFLVLSGPPGQVLDLARQDGCIFYKALGLSARALLLVAVDVACNVEFNELGERWTLLGPFGSQLNAEVLAQFRLGQNLACFDTSLAGRKQRELAEGNDTLPAANAVPNHPGTRT